METAEFYIDTGTERFNIGYKQYMFYTLSEMRQLVKCELIARKGNYAILTAYNKEYHYKLKNGKLYQVKH